MSQVVEYYEKTHAYEHWYILLQGLTAASKDELHEWFGYAVSQHVAHKDIESESHQRRNAFFVVAKRNILVKDITADTSENVIGGWRDPIAEVENIIEHKHDGCANNGVDDSHNDKFHEGFVSE